MVALVTGILCRKMGSTYSVKLHGAPIDSIIESSALPDFPVNWTRKLRSLLSMFRSVIADPGSRSSAEYGSGSRL
jgi:hypothetical protein